MRILKFLIIDPLENNSNNIDNSNLVANESQNTIDNSLNIDTTKDIDNSLFVDSLFNLPSMKIIFQIIGIWILVMVCQLLLQLL